MTMITRKMMMVMLSLLVAVSVTSCSGGGKPIGSDSQNTGGEDAKTKEEGPKIEDIEWSVEEGIVEGERRVVFNLTNNSQYPLAGLEITFTEKEDLSEEEKNAFYEDIAKMADASEEDMETIKNRAIEMHAETERVVPVGDSISNVDMYYYSGYFYVKNMDYYSLVTPDIATISYVDKDTIYKEYYDFKSQKYSMDDEKEEAQYWTTTELGTVIPKPDVPVIKDDGRDDDKCFMFEAYGLSLDDFNAYIDLCKEEGFTVDPGEYEGFYSADNSEGYNIYASYDEDDYSMSITVESPDNGESKEPDADED